MQLSLLNSLNHLPKIKYAIAYLFIITLHTHTSVHLYVYTPVYIDLFPSKGKKNIICFVQGTKHNCYWQVVFKFFH